MPGQFLSPDGDLESAFVSDPAIIDQFAKTGSLWLWGANNGPDGLFGALGDGTTTNRSTPVQTSSFSTNWKMVSSGRYFNLGIKTDGTLWTWGFSYAGGLGNNSATVRLSNPTQIGSQTTWSTVSAGALNVMGIKTDGTLWTWGFAVYGANGDGTTTERNSPVQLAGTTWKNPAFGYLHAGAIKTDNTLWMWGYNSSGQLGDGTTTTRSSPVQVAGTTWKQLSCGSGFSIAIKTDNTLWAWGANGNGQLGDGTTGSTSSPIQSWSGTYWKQVSAGNAYTAAIKTDGSLWTWGGNNLGQLGDNTTTYRSSPVQTASGGTNWKLVACSYYNHVLGLKTDGTLWAWGRNTYGEIGDNTTVDKSSPVQVGTGNNWKTIGIGSGGPQSAAIYFYDAGNLYP